jgi:hypothetical protein
LLCDTGDANCDWRRLPDGTFNAADLTAVVNCCPGLQTFGLCVRPGVKLSPLSSLSALVDLRVEGVTDASMQSLAALTQLTRLSVKLAEQGVRVSSLVGLTALRSLRQLQIDATAVRLTEEWEGVKLNLSSVSGGCLLLLLCEAEPCNNELEGVGCMGWVWCPTRGSRSCACRVCISWD